MAPTTVSSSVRTREYLTTREVERLMAAARESSRYGHRDATMILIGYRHGLRASELCPGRTHNARLLFLVAGRRGRRGTVRTTARIEPAQARNVDEDGAQGNAEGRSVTLQEVEARLCTLRVADARSYPA